MIILPKATRTTLIRRLKRFRNELEAPQCLITNAQIGLACLRKGVKWGGGSKYERDLITKYADKV